MAFPQQRSRRLRRTEPLRRLVQETRLSPSDFIYPLFITEGRSVRKPIASMPGIFNFSIDEAVKHAREVQAAGVPAVMLFGVPETKDAVGSSGTSPQGLVPRAVRELKSALPELQLIADVCLCEYTDHGHCGVVTGSGAESQVDNDRTLPLLTRMAVACAQAGADMVAPSDMMDGRVAAIRHGLDEAGLLHTPILSYAAKYASGFYGPFREAAQSTPQFGDRRGYQMDPSNVREALREVALDLEEGADLIMVKPALSYLDVISRVRQETQVPLAAYNVSGEYSMLKAAAQAGWLDYDRVMLETLTSIKRAGADLIVTYHALEASRLL